LASGRLAGEVWIVGGGSARFHLSATDDTAILTGYGGDSFLMIFDPRTGLSRYAKTNPMCSIIGIHPDSRELLTGNEGEYAIDIHDFSESSLELKETWKEGSITWGQFDGSGRRFIASQFNIPPRTEGPVLVFDWEKREVFPTTPKLHGFYSAAISPDGTMGAALGCTQSHLVVWRIDTGEILIEDQVCKGSVRSLALMFHPDEPWLACDNGSRGIKMWDLGGAGRHFTFAKLNGGIHSLRFSPDGERLVGAIGNGAAHVWDWRTGRLLLSFQDSRWGPTNAEFSRDGRQLYYSSDVTFHLRHALPWEHARTSAEFLQGVQALRERRQAFCRTHPWETDQDVSTPWFRSQPVILNEGESE